MKFNRKGIFFFSIYYLVSIFCVFCHAMEYPQTKKNIYPHTSHIYTIIECMTHKPFGTENENEKNKSFYFTKNSIVWHYQIHRYV